MTTDFFGTDLKFDGDLVRKDTGDLETVNGLENYKDALLRRWMTQPRTLVHRPEYGAGVREFANDIVNLSRKQQLAKRMEEQALEDDRTQSVESISFETEDETPEKLVIRVKVIPRGYQQIEIAFRPFGDEI